MWKRWCVTAAVVVAGSTVAPGAVAAGAVGVNFDFDAGPRGASATREWSDGCFDNAAATACVETTGKATLRAIMRDGGSALRFPVSGSAVMRVAHEERFNPGRANFTITAAVRLSAQQIKGGANVVQKGTYDAKRGQWKLQVDSGVPSCRISGETSKSKGATAEARGARALDRDSWTVIRCVREGSVLRLLVDNVEVDRSDKAGIDIHNPDAVLIGGKHSGPSNDQFRGDLDDVGVYIA